MTTTPEALKAALERVTTNYRLTLAGKPVRDVSETLAECDAALAQPQEAAQDVLSMVAAERRRQDEKWGGAEHDDEHSTADFVQLIQDYAAWARVMAGMGSRDKAQRRLVQVAALAVAAVESLRRQGGLTPEE